MIQIIPYNPNNFQIISVICAFLQIHKMGILPDIFHHINAGHQPNFEDKTKVLKII